MRGRRGRERCTEEGDDYPSCINFLPPLLNCLCCEQRGTKGGGREVKGQCMVGERSEAEGMTVGVKDKGWARWAEIFWS